MVLYCFGIYFLAHACAAFTPMAFCAFILLRTGSISFCSRYHKGLHLKAIMFIGTIMNYAITWDQSFPRKGIHDKNSVMRNRM